MPGPRPLLLLLACLPAAAQARTLLVAPGSDIPTLAEAARKAADGDTIRLQPGEYFECAILTQNQLVLEGQGAVLTDKTCEGKALLVLRGNGNTVRDLTLARARVPDGNGAGIRLEGQGLQLERVRFDNDQVGLLAGAEGGQIRLIGCSFEGGGIPGPRPMGAVMVGAAALLRIQGSTFKAGKGLQVQSGADRTELEDNRIEAGIEPDGPPPITSSGGLLQMRGNTLAIGPQAPARGAAILVTAGRAELRGNRLENTTGQPLALLLDWTSSTPTLDSNILSPNDSLSSTSGAWRHRAGNAARTVSGGLRSAAGALKRGVQGLLRW